MVNKTITLSGAATDVLYALFFRGALQSGDLPSKSGAAELRALAFAETRTTATEYQNENYFTFLTPQGQNFAIQHLVETRFGMTVNTQIFETRIELGIDVAEIIFKEKHSTEREKIHAVVSKYLTGEATEYTDELVDELISLRLPANSNQPEGKPSSVEFKADRFAIHKNAQSVIDNANALVSRGDCAGNTATAWRLSDRMHEAILNAVHESDLFKSIVARLNGLAASIADLAQVSANAACSSKKPAINDVPAMMAAGCQTAGIESVSTIEQETLSVVLANTLHVVPIEKVGDIAIQLSSAVKAAFKELEQEDAAAN